MNQQITINITNTPGIPDTGLNEFINSIGGAVSDNIGLFISIILLTLILATGIILSRKHLKTHKAKLGFFSLFLIPIAMFAITTSNQTADAAVSATFPNQTVNIEQGTTQATLTFNANIDSSTYTDGYDASPNLIAALPAGVSIQHNSQDITTAPGNIIAREYRTNSGADNGQIQYTVTIPADAPVGNNYATITLDYTVDDFIYHDYLAGMQTYHGLANMQDLTPLLCADADYDNTNNGVNSNNTVTLTDTRNSQQYMVRKLADNKCWMINNLKISLSDVAASPAASNLGINIATLTTQITPDNTGATYYNQPRYYDPAGGTDITSNTFYGYLYNWCAATGGTADTCTASGTQPTDATTDICPAGWRLPTGSATGEFAVLNNAMETGSLTPSTDSSYYANWQFDGPFKGVFSGRWNGSINDQGSYASLWASSSIPGLGYEDLARLTSFDSSNARIGITTGRFTGFSVRCML